MGSDQGERIGKRLHLISLVFFLSGAAALIYETAWFHTMGIVLGSSIWSAAAVLTAFMSGIALGNAVMAVCGHRFKNLVRLYVAIEIVIGISGAGIIFSLPQLTPLIANILSDFIGNPVWLNLSRFLFALLILLGPTVAMGMTLPVLQKLLYRQHPDFIRSLGMLYGWNTIGAVSGTLLAEFLFIHYLGITSAGLAACGFNFIAAFILFRGFNSAKWEYDNKPRQNLSGLIRDGKELSIAPFIVGLLLLALEIVWFRSLLLLNIGSSIVFAIMLAVVLTGIGLGGLIISRLKFDASRRDNFILNLPIIAAFSVSICFYLYSMLYTHLLASGTEYAIFIMLCLILMLPTCIISGMLFPLYGDKLFRRLNSETQAAGVLTFFNTLGAALGSALATFWLLPTYGLENSILILALGYFLVVIPMVMPGSKTGAYKAAGILLAIVLLIGLFPFGAIGNMHAAFGKLRFPNGKLVFIKEGLNETLKYYEFQKFGKPLKHRLVTNSYGMSGTDFVAVRYMQMFVYLPYILNQDINKVLLISYGVGNTAEAIASLDSVEKFDVVDISADILKHSSIIHAVTGHYPLQDPRAKVHIEDGRFFLQTTSEKYDLITAEPPPPQQAGVVNLYTQEYFDLIHARLEAGGIATYWLPVHSLREQDALAVTKAFCLVFADCSLWAGGGLDFILLGSKTGIRQPSAAAFTSVWQSGISGYLKNIGIEVPGQLAAMFIADNILLQKLIANTAPVTDNYPHRISPSEQNLDDFSKLYAYLLDTERRTSDFANSAYIREILPAEVIQESLGYFHYENLMAGQITESRYLNLNTYFWEELANILTQTKLEVLPLMLLNSSPREQAIIDAIGHAATPEATLAYAKRLLVSRRHKEAAGLIKQYIDTQGGFSNSIQNTQLYMLASALAGKPIKLAFGRDDTVPPAVLKFKHWYDSRFIKSGNTMLSARQETKPGD
jgi:spermidine synthase